eukprot:CAMPEP_0172479768 /NCGR_PEP_ID=MMETSP1066-20121228/4575_1 /TAXON_ID=671091 /ORGANISM="Coscinodiscus wailesii, Strain CCMP2513" /LENGTH=506 /DNA_ID=CAMNT_0013240531 /DNA_START=230 /DNA_END=1750 /DNA_ORIENTATION=-
MTQSSWSDLKSQSHSTPVGAALRDDAAARASGNGAAHVTNKLRLHGRDKPSAVTIFRDEAGWCPYCEKTILLVEEKKIPCRIDVVPMRSYGDKPREFMNIVPNGLLPAMKIEMEDGRSQVITESQVIMELLDKWFTPEEGHVSMMPDDRTRHNELARLERELFSWWCTFMFRPEGMPSLGGIGGLMGKITGNGDGGMSSSMKGFLDCLGKVDSELRKTPGPWFFESSHPMMIDLIFVSHIERMLASSAYWKGLLIRDEARFPGICKWFDAFDERESYLAFKSDFYTNVMDIPPQYGPGFFGGFEDKQDGMAKAIAGTDGKSWKLPLSHDDPLQPLYKGPPLPVCALSAADLDDYKNANSEEMAQACRHAAGWKLASNGVNVSRFAARGGPKGAKNPRKTFQADLADPYANPDDDIRPIVDATLRLVCEMLLLPSNNDARTHEQRLKDEFSNKISDLVTNSEERKGVISSLAYLRDRVGVPRDLPLAAARQLRAHLNWVIDELKSAN